MQEADKARISQVISNILNNAVKFTESKLNEGEVEMGIININSEKLMVIRLLSVLMILVWDRS